MKRKIFYKFLVLITISFYSTTNSYDNGLDFNVDWKTIKELKENIDYLDKVYVELDNDLKNLNTDNELKTYLRNDLTIVELNQITNLINIYNSNKSKIENELYQKAKEQKIVIEEKKALLEEKRKFYNWLIPYIINEYKDKYIEYIKVDAKIFNEQKDISTKIIAKKEILNTKVVNIEWKIQEHKDFINENINKIMETKLDEKIKNLNNNETFKLLNIESKKKILNKTILKIKEKLENIKNMNLSTNSSWLIVKKDTNLYDKKVQIFLIAISKLETFKESIK